MKARSKNCLKYKRNKTQQLTPREDSEVEAQLL